jgi:hypothetical protein
VKIVSGYVERQAFGLALTDKVKDKGKGKVIAVHSLSTTP